jgi:peptidoglycan biosynthesis protein MviN/MurJ (putative lipid II flippase)
MLIESGQQTTRIAYSFTDALSKIGGFVRVLMLAANLANSFLSSYFTKALKLQTLSQSI